MKILAIFEEKGAYNNFVPSAAIRIINVLKYFSDKYDIKYLYDITTITDILNYDLVIFQRCKSNQSILLLFALISHNIDTIYDIDDNLLLLPDESACKFTDIETNNIIQFLKFSKIITCSTENLKNFFKEFNKNIFIIPNRVLPDENQSLLHKSRDDINILISNTDYFKLNAGKQFFSQAVENIIVKYRNVKFIFFGAIIPEIEQLQAAYKSSIIIYPLSLYYDEYRNFIKELFVDFALVPLEDTEFHKYKSNIKFLDYASLGVPGIYSNIAPYKGCIDNNKTGMLVNNTYSEWVSVIELLIQNFSLRVAMGDNAYKELNVHYHIKDSTHDWDEALKSLNNIQYSENNVNEIYSDIVKKLGVIDNNILDKLNNFSSLKIALRNKIKKHCPGIYRLFGG